MLEASARWGMSKASMWSVHMLVLGRNGCRIRRKRVFSDDRAVGSLPLVRSLAGYCTAINCTQLAFRSGCLIQLTQAQHDEARDSFEPSGPNRHSYNKPEKILSSPKTDERQSLHLFLGGMVGLLTRVLGMADADLIAAHCMISAWRSAGLKDSPLRW
jgi:hypothetical protein